MSYPKAALKQSEVTRYAKAMRAAGYEDWRLVIRPDGSHEIIAGGSAQSHTERSDWD